ncbi:hypothetical protein EVAR_11454_1 [Eumeta japonica]|uniref:Uncharacterized protein n=1 Tax=Eumeta variegata TaxID=151549 RepID=A0A4C1TNF5_EUMVA|nr:hypothetical protein EVAR_11454_1 [Eumeta japonica]
MRRKRLTGRHVLATCERYIRSPRPGRASACARPYLPVRDTWPIRRFRFERTMLEWMTKIAREKGEEAMMLESEIERKQKHEVVHKWERAERAEAALGVHNSTGCGGVGPAARSPRSIIFVQCTEGGREVTECATGDAVGPDAALQPGRVRRPRSRARPSSPTTGKFCLENHTGKLVIYAGTALRLAASRIRSVSTEHRYKNNLNNMGDGARVIISVARVGMARRVHCAPANFGRVRSESPCLFPLHLCKMRTSSDFCELPVREVRY